MSEAETEYVEAAMYTCQVLYKQGKLMVTGHGSTKRQAERNAAVLGLKWLEGNQQEIDIIR